MLELGLHHLSYLLGRQRLDSAPSLHDCAQIPTQSLPAKSSGKTSSPARVSLRCHPLSADLIRVPQPVGGLTNNGEASSDSDLAGSLSETTSTPSIPAEGDFSSASSSNCHFNRSSLPFKTSIPDAEDLVFQHDSERVDLNPQGSQSGHIVLSIVRNQLGGRRGRIMKPIRLRKRKGEKQRGRTRTDPTQDRGSHKGHFPRAGMCYIHGVSAQREQTQDKCQDWG